MFLGWEHGSFMTQPDAVKGDYEEVNEINEADERIVFRGGGSTGDLLPCRQLKRTKFSFRPIMCK